MARPTLEQAKAQYTNRYTLDHVPAWAMKPAPNGKYYAPGFASDLEWYNATLFPGDPGHIYGPGYCMARGQSWPLGPWLDAPLNRRPVKMAFKALATGAWFLSNGNLCRKRSTRTADLISAGRWFFFKAGEPVAALN